MQAKCHAISTMNNTKSQWKIIQPFSIVDHYELIEWHPAETDKEFPLMTRKLEQQIFTKNHCMKTHRKGHMIHRNKHNITDEIQILKSYHV